MKQSSDGQQAPDHHWLLKGLNRLDGLPRPAQAGLMVLVVAVLGVGDFVTGAEVAFTGLYLLPIAVASWLSPGRTGLRVALICALSWEAAEFWGRLNGAPSMWAVVVWNFGIKLMVLGSVSFLVGALRSALLVESAVVEAEQQRTLAARLQLEHSDRLITVGTLAAGVAHELGTPLNVASTYSQMIEAGTVTGAEAVDGARIIREQTETMTRIIHQLLGFARAQKPHPSRQNVYDVVGAALSLVKFAAGKKRVEVLLQDGAPLPVVGDVAQLQQVLVNLVMNSIQATAEKGRVEVRVSPVRVAAPMEVRSKNDSWLAIEVKDNGKGILRDVLPRVFEPFFTTKPVGEGSGLGLSVAYGIVREHGGWMAAKSEPGKGAVFTVYLPRPADLDPPSAVPVAPIDRAG